MPPVQIVYQILVNDNIMECPNKSSNSSLSPIANERVAYLDQLRVIATLGVIFLHVAGTDYYTPIMQHNWYVAVIGDSLVRWSVPVFVMISGVLFLNPQKTITIHGILTKYVPRLLTAYLFWYIVYIIKDILILSRNNREFSFERSFLAPEFHLWFLPMLIGVYLLIPFLRKITVSEKLMRYALCIWFIYITVSFVLVREIPQISQLFTKNLILGYAGYFLLGYYLSIKITKRQQTIFVFLGFLGVLVTIIGNIAFSIQRGVVIDKFLDNLSPNVSMMAMSLFVLIKNNTPRIGKKTKYFIEYVRKDLFGIYLVHSIWLWVFNRPIFRNITDHLFTIMIITIVIFVCSLYTIKIMRLIPILRRVVE